MDTNDIQIGCQTFTWEMLGPKWTGKPENLVQSISAAGYKGIEITDTMIGHFADSAGEFANCLANEGLALVSFAFGSESGFTEKDKIQTDLETCRRWFEFAAHFPGALASMGSATIMSDGPREDKFAIAADIYNQSAEIAQSMSVALGVHPSSHHNTLFFSRNDYDQIFSLLNANVGWVPDTGHILRGGQDMIDTLTTYSDRILYVHLKDVDADGNWAMLGKGICDTEAVVNAARNAPRFNGWLVLEEESDFAASDPNKAVQINRQTLRALGY